VKHFSLALIDWEGKKIQKEWNPTCHEWYSERILDFPDNLPKFQTKSDLEEIVYGIYVHRLNFEFLKKLDEENSLKPTLYLELNPKNFYIRVKWATSGTLDFKQVEYSGEITKVEGFEKNYLLQCTTSQLLSGKKEDCTKIFNMFVDHDEKKVILRSKGILGKLCTVAKNEYILFHKETH
jgi:hypothetical protein